VFILPKYAIKYISLRAPDFFDWSSGVFIFPDDHKVSIPTINPRTSKLFEWLGYGLLAVTTIILLRINLPWPIVSLLIPFLGIFIGFLISGVIKAIRLKKDKNFVKFPFLKLVWRGIRATKFNIKGEFFNKPKNKFSYCDNAIKLDPFYHQAWFNRGNALGNLGRYEEAIASYDNALKIKPDLHEAWNNRGIALRQLGRNEEAIASYDEALKIKPDKHEAWNNRGVALADLGRIKEAIASYDNALKIKPDHANAYYNKACAYALQENIDLAIENLKQAMNLDSKYLEMAKTDTDFDKIWVLLALR
jgi:Tfp pilus assembly protein PilF